MNTDKNQESEKNIDGWDEIETYITEGNRFSFSLVRVHPCASVVPFRSVPLLLMAHKKIAASVPSQGVVLEWNRSAALMAAQPGG
jgi:hypothetical protein